MNLLGCRTKCPHLDPLAHVGKTAQLRQAAAKHLQGPPPVSPLYLKKSHPYLQDPLVQIANRTSFLVPGQFQVFMLFEIIPLIKGK